MKGFWEALARHPVAALADKQHLHVFQAGIQPLWEDPCNAGGGYVKITARTLEAAANLWVSLVVRLIYQQLPEEFCVTGMTVVYHARGFHLIKVWLGTTERAVMNRAKRHLLAVLDPSAHYPERITFVPHKLVLATSKRPEEFSLPGNAIEVDMAAPLVAAPDPPPAPAARHQRTATASSEDSLAGVWPMECKAQFLKAPVFTSIELSLPAQCIDPCSHPAPSEDPLSVSSVSGADQAPNPGPVDPPRPLFPRHARSATASSEDSLSPQPPLDGGFPFLASAYLQDDWPRAMRTRRHRRTNTASSEDSLGCATPVEAVVPHTVASEVCSPTMTVENPLSPISSFAPGPESPVPTPRC